MYRWFFVVFFLIAGGGLLLLPLAGPSNAVKNDSRPNILLIVLDDFGYNDLGANGNPTTPTPNLDGLAAQGVRYTRHYADATCSVARAALLTGQFPASHGLRPTHLGLSQGTPTIASALGQDGYRTQHIGKWHVVNATLEQSPGRLGFDNWFGFLFQSELKGASKDGINYPGPTYINPWLRENQSPPVQFKGHLTDILTVRAIEFLSQQKGQPDPWFLNLWFYAPHTPIEPAKRFKEKYPDTTEGAFHALIDQVDDSVGRVLDALDSEGMSDNTLVVVLSDNGGTNSYTDNNFPFYGKKTQFFEGGVRTPLLMRWPGHIEPDTVVDETVSILDIFPTILNAISASAPEGLVGRNLLAETLTPSPQLYWEYSSSVTHRFSILSADGRWRFSRGSWLSPILNDLDADPTGRENVVESHPEVAAALTDDYLHWRKKARRVATSYERLNDNGHAILRNKDLQRSPGSGGFTFAIGVTPKDTTNGPQVIAEQAERWHLHSDQEAGMSFSILGLSMALPALPPGRCSELVVTSHFGFTPIKKDANKVFIDMFVDGEKVGSIESNNPIPQHNGYSNPTYIGVNPHGQLPFMGTLSRPVILNERVVIDAQGAMIANGISDVPSTCPPKPELAI
jgi:arylsulfatase A-like enzyme